MIFARSFFWIKRRLLVFGVSAHSVQEVTTQTQAVSIVRSWSREMRLAIRHPVVGHAGLLAISQYISIGLSFLTTVIAARLLGPQEYGVAALVMGYPTLLWGVFGTKSVSVTTRYISNFRVNKQHTDLKSICKIGYSLDFFVSAVTFIFVAVTASWVARDFLNLPEIARLMIIYSACFPLFSLAGTSSAILTSWQEFRWLAAFQFFDKIIVFITVLWMLLSGLGASSVVIGIAVGQAATAVMMTGVATYILSRDGVGLWWTAHFHNMTPFKQELAAFFGWNFMIVTLNGLEGQVPVMLLGRFRGAEEAGLYRLTTNLMTVGSQIETALGKVIYPILSARWSTTRYEGLSSTFKRWTLVGGLPLGATVLLVIPFLPIGVPLVFGSTYTPMVLSAQIMMIGEAVSAVFFWLTSFYYASERINLWAKFRGLYSIALMGFVWPCIQLWGFLGLASLVTVGNVTFTVGLTFECWRYLHGKEKLQRDC